MQKRFISIAALASCLFTAAPAGADVDTGAYLAAKYAQSVNDFHAAGRFYVLGLRADPGHVDMRDSAQRAYVAQGDFANAVPMAQALVDQGQANSVSHLILRTRDFAAGDWDGVLASLDAGHSIGPLVDGISRGWAYIGRGDMASGMAAFDTVIAHESMVYYGLTHKAYALAAVGDFEGAHRLLVNGTDGMRYSRQSALAHAQILSQLGQNDSAIELLESIFGPRLAPELAAMRDALRAGEAVAYDAVRTPAQAMGDLFHVIATLIEDETPTAFTLVYTRAANHLWPDHASAQLMTARLLEDVGQYDLANAAYARVPQDDPLYHAAELGRAEALRAAGRDEAAVEVLDGLARRFPELAEVYAAKGDTLREARRYAEANRAYTEALARYDDLDRTKWFVYYVRAITHHRLDDWEAAEADFRAALALRPEQPQVLNYLGYSLVERGEKLDEALAMIETAVAARPDNGAIVDSLGWVYFKLGRFDDAVAHLEHAASLEPADPTINDHLGDALWAVGRVIEARFQWQRALSFGPAEDEAVRIRAKLDDGLDAVLAEEGRDPIRFAGEDSVGEDS